MNTETTNLKDSAQDFLRLVASGNVREAYRLYAGEGFRHHNVFFKGDAASLMAAMEENAALNPNKVLEIHRVLQDGDLVATHSHIRQNPDELGAAVVHIFRFQNKRIVELWDLGMAVPAESVNEHGMF